MIRIFTIISLLFLSYTSTTAQDPAGFLSVRELTALPVTKDTGETPQSKAWAYGGHYWAVLPDATGTHLWRLEGDGWVKHLKLSDILFKADCKVDGNLAHILLFRGRDIISMASLEYVSGAGTYKFWSKRSENVDINIGKEAYTATIEVDSKGRMWLASDAETSIDIRWSDIPYTTWSEPVSLASGVTNDDQSAIVKIRDKIGVMWTDLNKKRYGFKTHADGADPTAWSEEEIPSSQSALDLGGGMVSNSINLASTSDGTLYAAIKTSFNTPGHPRLALLVRRPSGNWDDLYSVSGSGDRPVVILNEEAQLIRVVYNTSRANNNDIVYKQSPMSGVTFTPEQLLLKGPYTDISSTKDTFTEGVVILASNETHTAGVIAFDKLPEEDCCDWTLYPNPFNDITSLYFKTTATEKYNLTIYSSTGEQLTSLSGDTKAGEVNRIEIDGEKFASGLYMVRLQTKAQNRVFKVIISK
ncbi:T9SS type A sorting domain-containing protein [Pontibacter kalidii]|uniref:T9SS type A sorting domain-containing protein n=1 Tax=Pontibacter kalidii TaxID=2592049 RepID=UPI00224C8037|nr:T9SS type A sorting domain-containing protein [Pontibacter kalidii]